ncbi:MAG TPA: phosphopantetheine-binding protein [Blastocatellia bacterium]|nr:phosphopantetheine-binding protein [Blastocatellia bacterium]
MMIGVDHVLAALSPKKRALLALRVEALSRASAARRKARGAKRLIAYVVPAAGESPTSKELRSFLAQKLPEYMVPASYVFLGALPLTSSGKIDRRALPLPLQAGPDAGAGFVAPRDDVEEVMAAIWAEVLGLDRVGVESNFFELGGHSLTASQVIYRVRDLFQTEIPIRCLFESPTVAEICKVLVASEPVPGLTLNIAQAFKAMRRMSSSERQRMLDEVSGRN